MLTALEKFLGIERKYALPLTFVHKVFFCNVVINDFWFSSN